MEKSITQQAQEFFGAPKVTIRGSHQLWGRTFKRKFDLSCPKDAEVALRRYKYNSAQYARWQEAMANFETDLDRWPTPGHYFQDVFMDGNPDHALRNPCTFLKVTKHRR